ncbi:MAG: GNAT family N-acetyltransferase [Hyphomonas sp.]|nr:GNAT family N-acetyltransferase [Hyphomonas sp.]
MVLLGDEIAALERNLWSQWARFGAPADCAWQEQDGVSWLETPIASLPYNGVFRFDVPVETADARMDALIHSFDARQVNHVWLLHPSARPEDIEARLNARGFSEFEVLLGMVADPGMLQADTPPADGVEIREITRSEETPILELVADRWSVPTDALHHLQSFFRSNRLGEPGAGIRGWMATINGQPVGKAFINVTGKVGGLYGVAIKPEARGRGVGLAICAEALRATVAAGADLLVLHSTPMAVELYRRMGFREVAPFSVFARGG